MFSLKRDTVGVGLMTLVCFSGPARGGLIVRFGTPDRAVETGEVFTMDILADVGDPLVGWGLDLSFDPSILSLVDPPAMGPRWSPANAPDGDGLAGLAFVESVSGADVLLASVTFFAVSLGETDLILSTTSGDLNEGFALDPTGFAEPVYQGAHVSVVPEPPTGLLCVIALATIALARRCAGSDPCWETRPATGSPICATRGRARIASAVRRAKSVSLRRPRSV
jgi:hypothetical protein